LKKNFYLLLKTQKQTLAYIDKLVPGISAKHLMKWLSESTKKTIKFNIFSSQNALKHNFKCNAKQPN
jgi:hypothetical protein